MFQPARARSRRLPLLVAAALVLLTGLAVAGLLVTRGHGSAPSSQVTATARPTPAPVQTLQGRFTATTMTCPGKPETAGNTCVIALTLPAGVSRVTVASPGQSLLALGIQDTAAKELGPQVTGDKGAAVFVTPALAAGSYRLRVVNVQLPGKPRVDFDFTVTITTS